jgi:hypothetical protein
MVRRIVLLLAVAAVGWYVISRMLRPKEVYFDDDEYLWPDEQGGSAPDRVSDVASGAIAATRDAAETPIDRIRSIVGEQAAMTADAASDSTDTVATPSQHDGAGQSSGSDAGPAATVKGNINRDGEKIYHLPGDPAYERTHAEEMFRSAEEAEAAGFRRAGQRPSI